MPLSIAEDKLPQCINPLSLHIMRLTSEYVSNTSLEKDKESDGESTDSRKSLPLGRSTLGKDATERRSYQIRKFFGQTVKRTVIRFAFLIIFLWFFYYQFLNFDWWLEENLKQLLILMLILEKCKYINDTQTFWGNKALQKSSVVQPVYLGISTTFEVTKKGYRFDFNHIFIHLF